MKDTYQRTAADVQIEELRLSAVFTFERAAMVS